MDCPRALDVLNRLMEGNRRFARAAMNDGDVSPALRRSAAEEGQRPQATVLSCSDSRVVPEAAFMAGLGELFVVRVAGNVALGGEVASVVYGACHLHTPLVLVMGHTGCGAVAAALAPGGADPSLACVVDAVRAAAAGTRDADEAARRNVLASVATLKAAAPLAELEAEGALMVCGALYHLASGRVELLDAGRGCGAGPSTPAVATDRMGP